MKLDIQILQMDGNTDTAGVTVKLAGSLDTSTAPELENQLKNIFLHPRKDLIFDLADLKFISSAGLRVFAIARKVMKENSGETHFSICSLRYRQYSRSSNLFQESLYSRICLNSTPIFQLDSVPSKMRAENHILTVILTEALSSSSKIP